MSVFAGKCSASQEKDKEGGRGSAPMETRKERAKRRGKREPRVRSEGWGKKRVQVAKTPKEEKESGEVTEGWSGLETRRDSTWKQTPGEKSLVSSRSRSRAALSGLKWKR